MSSDDSHYYIIEHCSKYIQKKTETTYMMSSIFDFNKLNILTTGEWPVKGFDAHDLSNSLTQ